MNHDTDLMEMLMDAIFQAEEWRRISVNDPMILEANQAFASVLNRARKFLPGHLLTELEEANTWCSGASEYAAMLYGVYVADTLRAAALKPESISKLISERTQQKEAV